MSIPVILSTVQNSGIFPSWNFITKGIFHGAFCEKGFSKDKKFSDLLKLYFHNIPNHITHHPRTIGNWNLAADVENIKMNIVNVTKLNLFYTAANYNFQKYQPGRFDLQTGRQEIEIFNDNGTVGSCAGNIQHRVVYYAI